MSKLRDSHRASDRPLIAKGISTFTDIARAGYAEHGRGIVVYMQQRDEANYVPASVWEKGEQESEDELRMLRNYDPLTQFVIGIWHTDGSSGTYQIQIPAKQRLCDGIPTV